MIAAHDSIKLNSKNRRTLESVFERPAPAGIRWDDVCTLVAALNGTVEKSGGSARCFDIHGRFGYFHEPHPENTMKRTAVKRFSEYLLTSGVVHERP